MFFCGRRGGVVALMSRKEADAFCAIHDTPAPYSNDDVTALFGIYNCPSSHFFDARIGRDLREQRGFETSTCDAHKHLLHPAGSKNTRVGNDKCFAASQVASIASS